MALNFLFMYIYIYILSLRHTLGIDGGYIGPGGG